MIEVVVTVGNFYNSSGVSGLGKKDIKTHCLLSGGYSGSCRVVSTAVKTEFTVQTPLSN